MNRDDDTRQVARRTSWVDGIALILRTSLGLSDPKFYRDNATNEGNTACVLRDHDDTLARLKKLSDQLDSAKKAVDQTAREIARAQDTTETTSRAVRLHQSTEAGSKKPRIGKKR